MTLYHVKARLRGNLVDSFREMTSQEARDTRRRMSYAGFSSVRVVPVRESRRARAHTREIQERTYSEAGALRAEQFEALKADYESLHPKPVGGY